MELLNLLMSGDKVELNRLIRTDLPSLHPLQSQSIDSRWKEWEPWMAIEARKTTDPASCLHRLKTTHRSRTIALLGAGVTWKQIRAGRLDDPMTGENLFQFSLRAAVERHRMMKLNVGRRTRKPSKNPSTRKMKEMRIP